MLTRCFYVSEIAEGVTDVDVRVIVGTAQLNNRRRDVTGMLVQSDTHFAQVLEGRDEAVAGLLAKIRTDTRHTNVRVVLEEAIVLRQFGRWAMAVVRRHDHADELRRLHRDGGADPDEVRRLIAALMAVEP